MELEDHGPMSPKPPPIDIGKVWGLGSRAKEIPNFNWFPSGLVKTEKHMHDINGQCYILIKTTSPIGNAQFRVKSFAFPIGGVDFINNVGCIGKSKVSAFLPYKGVC